jgi:glycosyltransferase involved in cell wall biosynthesis
MPTANRRRFVPEAIRLFLAQDHAEKELIILDDGEDMVADLIPADPQIRYTRNQKRQSVGAKRNLACEQARGEIIAHWDDDDWYAPWRLSYQLRELTESGADLNGLDRVLFRDEARRRAWEYVHPRGAMPWVHGATMCYRKSVWQRSPFPEINVGEDTRFVANLRGARILALPENGMFVGVIHSANTSPKHINEPRWQPQPMERIESVMRRELPPRPLQAAAIAGGPALQPADLPRSEKTPPPSVCVGVHLHSQPERLGETLAHLATNSPPGVEILLLVDGPDPATRATLARLAQPRQSATSEPHGAAACFNRLLRESPADVLVFLESGSLVGPGWLDLILAALQADPRNGLAGPTTNIAWSLQGAFRDRRARAANVAELAAQARAQFGTGWRTLEPLYCLADFCYAIRRGVADAIGAADEEYGLGPCWEMDYTARAVRSGFQAVWAQSAYVFRHPFSPSRSGDEARLLETNKWRYQDLFCGLKLNGARAGYARHCRGDACTHFAPVDRIRRVIPLTPPLATPRPIQPAAERTLPPSPAEEGRPLVSCITPTRDRLDWLLQSIKYFVCQDYPRRELVIVDDGVHDLSSQLPHDPRIRYLRPGKRLSIGEKRNFACDAASGSIIAHWDDDDWYGSNRLSAQLAPLLAGTAEVTALQDTVFFDLDQWQFWKCSEEIYSRLFVRAVHGGTLVFRRELFVARARYPDRSLAEDALFLLATLRSGARLQPVSSAELFLYVRHATNAWVFTCGHYLDARGWQRIDEPQALAPDRAFYASRSPAGAARRRPGTAESDAAGASARSTVVARGPGRLEAAAQIVPQMPLVR